MSPSHVPLPLPQHGLGQAALSPQKPRRSRSGSHSGSGRDTRDRTANCSGLDLKERLADAVVVEGLPSPQPPSSRLFITTRCRVPTCCRKGGAGNLSALKRASVDVLALVPFPQYLLYIVVQSLSPLSFATPWTAHQTPLSTGFTQQEYQSGLPFPSPGGICGSNLWLLHWQGDSTN